MPSLIVYSCYDIYRLFDRRWRKKILFSFLNRSLYMPVARVAIMNLIEWADKTVFWMFFSFRRWMYLLMYINRYFIVICFLIDMLMKWYQFLCNSIYGRITEDYVTFHYLKKDKPYIHSNSIFLSNQQYFIRIKLVSPKAFSHSSSIPIIHINPHFLWYQTMMNTHAFGPAPW